MTDPNQLSAKQRLHESMELRRKIDDPRIDAMVKDSRDLRIEIKGLNRICNFATGNSREAIEVANLVFARMDKIEERQERLDERQDAFAANMDIIFERLDTMGERIENMAQWAKTKGKT